VRVAIIGAGFAGLVTAVVLRELGLTITVYEKCPDVGGVWSATRRYPGMRTQNGKDTYALSDAPMPPHYPEWPNGEQVQNDLEDYVEKHDLASALELGTDVIRAELDEAQRAWSLTVRTADGGSTQQCFDHVVVANGVYSVPDLPELPGREEHEAAGGQVLATSEVHDADLARVKHVVVIGYGKSACDIAEVAASTTLVARRLLWKMPPTIAGVLNYKHLMLTRAGEALFRYIEPRGVERVLHGPGEPLRRRVIAALQAVVTRQLGLRRLGVVPPGTFEDIARSAVSLATDGFYEAVASGQITVRRESEVLRLLARDGAPYAELKDGSMLPADLVLCGTGHRQAVPFFDDDVQERLRDQRGRFRLHRHIHPLDVPHLFFAGYNSSFFSPLSAEVAAAWIGSLLTGRHTVHATEDLRARIDERLEWMESRTDGRHSSGTNVIPFSMHTIDEALDDIGLNIPRARRVLQWLTPVDPSAYVSVTTRLQAPQRLRAVPQ